MKKLFSLYIIVFCSLCLTGCAGMLVGAGAAGAYTLTPDSATGNFDADFTTVWLETEKAVTEVGEITFESEQEGKITGITPKATKFTITVERVTDYTTTLTVKARRNMLPRLKEAQKLFNTVIRRIKTNID